MHDTALTISTLRLRGPADTPGLRVRLERGLGPVDPRPAGLPPGALLLVRRLSAAPVGRSRAAWEGALRAVLADHYRHAARPAHGPVADSVPAVLFADRAELLACLADDLACGRAGEHWWWRAYLHGKPPALAQLPALLAAEPAALPAALALLARTGRVERLLQALTPAQAAGLALALARHFGAALDLPTHGHPAPGQTADGSLRRPMVYASTARPPHSRPRFSPPAIDAPSGEQAIDRRATGEHPDLRGLTQMGEAGTDTDRVQTPAAPPAAHAHAAAEIPRIPAAPAPTPTTLAWSEQREQAERPASQLAVPEPARPRVGAEHAARDAVHPPLEEPRAAMVGSSERPAPSPPWEGLAGAAVPPGLACERALLLGMALSLAARPAAVTGAGFRARLAAWWAAQPATARPPEEQSVRPPGASPMAPPVSPIEGDPIAPQPAIFPAEGVPTELGGVLFLINLLIHLDLPECVEPGWGLADRLGAWGLLELVARGLLAADVLPDGQGVPDNLQSAICNLQWDHLADDPIWSVLAALDGRSPGAPPAYTPPRRRARPGIPAHVAQPYRIPAAWLAALRIDAATPAVWASSGHRLRIWSARGVLLIEQPARRPNARTARALLSELGLGAAPLAQGAYDDAPLATLGEPSLKGSGPDLRAATPHPRLYRWLARALPAIRLRLTLALGGAKPGANTFAAKAQRSRIRMPYRPASPPSHLNREGREAGRRPRSTKGTKARIGSRAPIHAFVSFAPLVLRTVRSPSRPSRSKRSDGIQPPLCASGYVTKRTRWPHQRHSRPTAAWTAKDTKLAEGREAPRARRRESAVPKAPHPSCAWCFASFAPLRALRGPNGSAGPGAAPRTSGHLNGIGTRTPSLSFQPQPSGPRRARIRSTPLPYADPTELAPDLLLRRGLLQWSATSLDLTMGLGAVSLPVRVAGLDRDPGWIAEFGRVIRFHFEETADDHAGAPS